MDFRVEDGVISAVIFRRVREARGRSRGNQRQTCGGAEEGQRDQGRQMKQAQDARGQSAGKGTLLIF